ncbi:MAG: head decoration protein [Hyphomicrobiaceae bacterium]
MGLLATYPRLSMEWLKHETDPDLGREEIVIAAEAGDLKTGTVLGRITKGDASSAAKAGGNTGGGTLTLDVTTPILAGASPGVYKVRCIASVTDGGEFSVEDPDGFVIGNVAVGATFADQIKFVLADSGTDFAVGDGFDVTIDDGSAKWVPCEYGAVDGSGVAAGILLDGRDASGEDDVKGVAVIADARVAAEYLTWDASFDDANKKAAALAQLAALNIKTVRAY